MAGPRDRPIGKVYLVGAGPGDPGLLTLRGRDCLAESDQVIYDYLANEKLLVHARPEAERIFAGKHGGGAGIIPQEEITRLLIAGARAGKVVTRLKGGDPFLFGRGGEEAEALAAAGIPFEIVPGVTAATAVPAYAGIPLTHRDLSSSVAFITGNEDVRKPVSHVDWEKIAEGVETLVIFMGMRNLPQIAARLMAGGKPAETPAAVIRWGTTPIQQTVVGTLADIAEKTAAAGFKPPGIVVIGEVVRLRDRIAWFERRPLLAKRVIVTRMEKQAGPLVRLLTASGADVIEFPTLEIVPPESWEPVDRAIGDLPSYDWILFTSANGVRWFMERLAALGGDTRRLGSVRVCAVGPKTAEALGRWGVRPDVVPKVFRAEGVIESLGSEDLRDRKILFPRATEGREVLMEGLAALGARVTLVPVYRAVPPAADPAPIRLLLREKKIDAILFTSPATARNFVEMVGETEYKVLLKNVALACISPVTADAVVSLGLVPAVVAPEATVEALADAVAGYFTVG
ncbi:MAG: uroporphyrinogen-III C-methyltransferase [Nitrospirae bacterium]|nr:uroporphyrinogen-III C-methyltransferase [Nitrospirota bacterium]